MAFTENSMIQILDRQLVNLITAGEVIDSPVAVVRELVENALDGGAERILIRLCWQPWRLEVLDNGRGMTLAELESCALPHATSKIKCLADLEQIKTLGFRGEALHSLTQVAEVTISSRFSNGKDCGWQRYYSPQGQVSPTEPVAIAVGTRVEVRELFANFPQRNQAFSKQQVLKATLNYLQKIALCHPQVTWQLWQDERLRLSISPSPHSQGILLQCLKSLKSGQLCTVNQPLSPPTDEIQAECQLKLIFSYPDRYHRPRADWLIIAINGRPVNLPELEQTVLSIFYRILPRQRYPLCFLHLQLPPQWIDWHRHPAKTEIYLQHLPHWQQQIQTILQENLGLLTAQTTPRINQLLKAAEPTGVYQLQSSSFTDAVLGTDQNLKAIAQVSQTYVVVEHPQGVWLVEQHVAHERILFEQLQKDWQCIALAQPLLLQKFSPEQIEQLQNFGLEIDPFGEDVWAVRTLPQLLIDLEAENLTEFTDLIPILQELSQLDSLTTVQAAIACRRAIKNGTVLERGEINRLIEQWQKCENPRTCPHGRPIYLALEESSLARFFRRNWLINPS